MTTPTPKPNRWADLTPRVGSAIVMIVVGYWAVWMGNEVFRVFIAIVCGAMVWELVRMLTAAKRPIAFQLGALSGSALLMASYLPAAFALPLLVSPALVGFGQLKQHRRVFTGFCLLILLAGYGMITVRDTYGLSWMLWLVLVVVVTDIAGYFAGRIFGGPKFWPRFSPKKTWSGTVAGWVGAAVVGWIFATQTGTGFSLILISIAVSIASQMGDIGESAIKRMVGVKDSSNLIPGHGGFLDRFDGMLGASVFVLLISLIIGFPAGNG